MKNILLLMLLSLTVLMQAQTEATTKDGKAVLLFENGTWEFVTEDNVKTVEVESVDIKKDLTKESELEELYYTESKRLVKFFGPIKGKIKGRAKCMIVAGHPKLFFQWEFSLLDSYRYFGQMKKGKKVILKTKNNTPIELVLNEDVDSEFMEKYNFSTMKGACNLSDEQFKLLLNSSISEVEVEWKKESETYKVNDAYFFSKSFQALLK